MALQFYCSKIIIDKTKLYKGDAPLILASTHPNSFLDAMILAAYHPRKFYFLARGDAFQKKWAATLLGLLNLKPVYRISEGKNNLDKNHQTFTESVDILLKGGAIIIFSEGLCVNEWKLRALKKGTARIAWMYWQECGKKDMLVQPVGINYHSFQEVPKRVYIEYGDTLAYNDFKYLTTACFYKDFNERLTERLLPLCVEENSDRFIKHRSQIKKTLLAIPAIIGYIIHKPFYAIWRSYIGKRTKGSVFYDSVLFASLLLLYPLLVLLATVGMVVCTGNALWWLLFLLLPITAWSYKQFKSY